MPPNTEGRITDHVFPDAVAAYWDAHADTFDEEADHGLTDPLIRGAWHLKLRSWLPEPPVAIADIGCGTGSLSVLLAEQGYHVTGIDLSHSMVANARAKATAAGVDVDFACGDAAAPALDPASVDAVLVRHLMWTLPDPHAAVHAWTRLVRPGGRLVLIEGRWQSSDEYTGPGPYDDLRTAIPWYGGTAAQTLVDTLKPLVQTLRVDDLSDDPELWGKPINDERFAVIGITPA